MPNKKKWMILSHLLSILIQDPSLQVNSFSLHEVRTTHWRKSLCDVHCASLSKRNWCLPNSNEFFKELLVAVTAVSGSFPPSFVLVAVIRHVPFE